MKIASIESQFSAAHFYKQKNWSAEKNKETFGRCFTEYGHGHNYRLKLEIEIPEKISNSKISSWLSEQKRILNSITNELDHEHLNFVIPAFKKTVPTTENILIYLTEKVKESQLQAHAKTLQLFEMEDLWTKISLEK